MTKNFNRDLDRSDGERARKTAHSEGRPEKKAPDSDAEVARERSGEGFDGPTDELSEAGSRGAGYREAAAEKKKSGS
jgi:hypothetical protein